MKSEKKRVQVTIEFEMPLPAGDKPNPFLQQILYDHVLKSATMHHLMQAMKWMPGSENHTKFKDSSAKGGGDPDAIYKVHDNWGEILSNASMTYTILK